MEFLEELVLSRSSVPCISNVRFIKALEKEEEVSIECQIMKEHEDQKRSKKEKHERKREVYWVEPQIPEQRDLFPSGSAACSGSTSVHWVRSKLSRIGCSNGMPFYLKLAPNNADK